MVLVEVAGSILGPLAGVAGGDRFLKLFEQILAKLLAKLVGAYIIGSLVQLAAIRVLGIQS